MVGRVTTGVDVRDVDNLPEGILNCISTTLSNFRWIMTHVVKTGCDQEISVLVIAGTSPEVSDLLWLDVGGLERETVQGRSGKLKDWQRRGVVGQRFGNTWDLGDQGREADTKSLVQLGGRGRDLGSKSTQESGER